MDAIQEKEIVVKRNKKSNSSTKVLSMKHAVDVGFGKTKVYSSVEMPDLSDENSERYAIYQSGIVYRPMEDELGIKIERQDGDTVNVVYGNSAAFLEAVLPPTVYSKYKADLFYHAVACSIWDSFNHWDNKTYTDVSVELAVTYTPTTGEVDTREIKQLLFGKEFKIRNVNFRIVDVKLVMEGFASYYAHRSQTIGNIGLNGEFNRLFTGNTSHLVIDIGTGTSDIVLVENERKQRQVVASLNRGIRDVVYDVYQKIQRQTGTLDMSLQKVFSLVDEFAMGKKSVALRGWENMIEDSIRAVADDLAGVLKSEDVKRVLTNDVTRVIVTGGAGWVFFDEIQSCLAEIFGRELNAIAMVVPAVNEAHLMPICNAYGAWCIMVSGGSDKYFVRTER